MQQSDSSQKGISILPDIEKSLDELSQLNQIQDYIALERPIMDYYAYDVNEMVEKRRCDRAQPRLQAFLLPDPSKEKEAYQSKSQRKLARLAFKLQRKLNNQELTSISMDTAEIE